ncbi:Regulatory protein, luxR family [Sphingomonas aurantiaca]|mgnify:CR=1 FL=1|jgi:DNA-binding CsgD family transcriptional regulator|uniref:Regulatory LuxR family protein n=1 Tax=Sphingomonas aurantiaca TaxID=185949 RepID=A0A2T5GIG6_9SPHN|nr:MULTISPECIES: helix-turn-helix domain-containing protein [Sphingomonas]PTQ59116.1 regulatory LuxR family protein [Sphingomonas aurantiaca]RYF07007.1 MAG: helix-turn-helix transcriptional regulator [Oxalobacteraceae bacterium]RZT53206.1 regulatory LuxR family protein [Sphingomonas sp. BK036]VVT14759.1 Regulatory protein, luxR family [Sphingomonas aurantiaca]
MDPVDPEGVSSLTARELHILRLTAAGFSAKEIAKQLRIAPRTVERHIDHVRLKTRTRNRSHMVAFAVRNGCV